MKPIQQAMQLGGRLNSDETSRCPFTGEPRIDLPMRHLLQVDVVLMNFVGKGPAASRLEDPGAADLCGTVV